MTPQQARLLVSILHRLAGEDKIAHEQIDAFANAIGAFADIDKSPVTAGAPDVGRPALTVHTD